MKVLKFGGTSVGSAESIQQVAKIIGNYKSKGEEVAVVVSALKGTTNQLIEVGKKAASHDESYKSLIKNIENNHFTVARILIHIKEQSTVIAQLKLRFNEIEELLHGVFLLRELSARSLDLLQSFGERLSAYLIAAYFRQEGLETDFLDTRDLVKTDDNFGKANVDFQKTNANIVNHFEQHKAIQLMTGFIASTEKNETTTLGRGGSDYTAAIFGAALDAEVIEIWTDVDGVMTSDPRVVKEAFSLPSLTYEEAMEMSHFGAKVIYPPTLQPAFSKKIPLKIRNTFNPDFEGTLIYNKPSSVDYLIKGISSIADISLINISGSGMVGVSGVSSRLFGALAQRFVNLVLITQASSEHSICFAIAPEDVQKAQEAIHDEFEREMEMGLINEVKVESDLSVVAVIGENMRKTPGMASEMFGALGRNGVSLAAIAQGSSELNISVVIDKKHLSKAINSLHEAFFLSNRRTLNLFMVGAGLIGSTLLKQMESHAEYLMDKHQLKINVIGMMNTKKMVFNESGLDISKSKDEILSEGDGADLEKFVEQTIELNLPNSVFVDCTSNPSIVGFYEQILKSSISIVTPSKLANSGPYERYRTLLDLAERHNVKFLYETNVGAGLPVINPLKDFKISGDQIIKIEGVLSGTLSYIFTSFKKGTSFAEIVKDAKEKGFTEPDPREDLNGMDVARKILILAREAGFELEPEDVTVENILPQACLDAKSVDDFFTALAQSNDYFTGLLEKAEEQNKVLRFIASLADGKADVGLKAVGEEHPCFHMSGSDNLIAFTSERYKDRPLVVKGPGAGAEVTAAGVFAEIISLHNYLS